MEVILLESFNKLGNIGDVVNVKDGFARNFLIPKKKALRANKENKDYFSKIKDDLIKKNKNFVEDAKNVIKKISGREIVFIRNASDNGQLYGSVSPKDISNYFLENKLDIKPSNINLHNAIKKIGIYEINIKLHPEVGCKLEVNVATSKENAEIQKKEANKPEDTNPKKNEKKAKNMIADNSKEETLDDENNNESVSSQKEPKNSIIDEDTNNENKEIKTKLDDKQTPIIESEKTEDKKTNEEVK